MRGQMGGRDDQKVKTSAAVTAKPAPDSAAAIEVRVPEMVLVPQSQRQPGLTQPAAAPRRPPSSGFHDTIRTAAEVKKQV